jgi:hypothetical protein
VTLTECKAERSRACRNSLISEALWHKQGTNPGERADKICTQAGQRHEKRGGCSESNIPSFEMVLLGHDVR